MRAIFAAIAVAAIALTMNAALLRHEGVRELLVPAPAKVVQGFVGAVAARRPEIARTQLSREPRAKLSAEALRARAAEFRDQHGDYRYESGDVHRSGDVADVQAHLRTKRDGTIIRTFRLVRDPETSLWKITEFSL